MAEQAEASGSGQNTANVAYKIFNDSVHGHIKMHPLLVDIIDTPEFQRLRNIKQMGGIYYVFPGASHNRFEHSLGVGYLAGELVRSLKAQRSDITSIDMFCVQIAGLCHDLGHGPFSHLFEHFVEELSEKLVSETEESETTEALKKWKHEAHSGKIFDLLIKNGIENKMKDGYYKDEDGQDLKFTDEDFKFIHELIEGPPPSDTSQWPYEGRGKEKSYLYEIVANKCTGIDVDKMDYISRDCHHLGMKSNFSHERFMMFARVCTNEEENKEQICMRDKEAMNMYELFHNRYMLHYKVCHHRVTVAIETMIVDALLEAEGHFKLGDKTISEAVMDPKTYLKLTDDILLEIMRSKDTNLQNAVKLISRINKRQLYKLVGSNIFKTTELKPFSSKDKKVLVRDWLWYIEAQTENPRLLKWQEWIKNGKITEKHFSFKLVELNYGKKMEDPIKYLRFYRKSNLNKSVKLTENEVSYMLPKTFSETKVMVFYKGLKKIPKNPPLKPLWVLVRTYGSEDSSEEPCEESSEESCEESSEESCEESSEESCEESREEPCEEP